MDFKFTPEQEAFRAEIREFLKIELPKEDAHTRSLGIDGFSKDFSRKVSEKGWIGLAWPKEYGGKELDQINRVIFTEEMVFQGAPSAAHWGLDRQIGPSIIAHGTDEQKKNLLPKFLSAEISVCVGYSEPDAGSDLASLKCRAVEEGDEFVINGQKTWISNAAYSDYVKLAVRTDTSAPKHKGISEILVDLKSPGITIRPMLDMSGSHHLCDVFFENVRVPRSNLIGKLNQGWQQMTNELAYERSGVDRLMNNRNLVIGLVNYIREQQQKQPGPRWEKYARRLAEIDAEFEVGRLFCYRVASVLAHGRTPSYEASFSKVYGSELEQRTADLAMEILGLHGGLMHGGMMHDPKWQPLAEKTARAYLRKVAYTFQGGASEIQRNIIARSLNLPMK